MVGTAGTGTPACSTSTLRNTSNKPYCAIRAMISWAIGSVLEHGQAEPQMPMIGPASGDCKPFGTRTSLAITFIRPMAQKLSKPADSVTPAKAVIQACARALHG
ncbi:hypothetical protein GCM10027065_03630 [Rhodanobacter koreensis]